MSQYLPTGEFKIVPLREVDIEQILQVPDDADYGYFLEVDLSYPEELHEYFDEFPPGPERKAPGSLSPFQRSLLAEDIRAQNPKLFPEAVEARVEAKKPATKLIATLEKKTKHICHYRLLKKYVELGMKVDRVRQVIRFAQSPWMESFITQNSDLRKDARNEFEKEFYKLMNNR